MASLTSIFSFEISSAASSTSLTPEWSKAVEWVTLEAASSSTRGSGGALSGSASFWECRAAQSRQACPEEAQEPSLALPGGAL